jgi:adenylate cyclase 10
MPLRKFFFAALSEDQLEEWSIYLEFAKAKAIYDEFVANFGKISFPIGINQDNYDQSIRIDISSKPQKLNFGWGGLGETNKQQGTNLSRRASRASKAIIASHKLTVVKEKSADDPLTALAVAQLEISNLKNMLKLFLRKSTFLLYSHVFEMSLQRSEDSYRTFGKTIRICYKHKHIFDVSP